MDTLPRPRAVKRHDAHKSNLLKCIEHETKKRVWGPPRSVNNIIIKEAVNFGDVLYAIDERGKLVLGKPKTIDLMKNHTILALRSEANTKLYFILEDKVLLERSD